MARRAVRGGWSRRPDERGREASPTGRRLVVAVLVAITLASTFGACGSAEPAVTAPADLLLSPRDLPGGFTTEQLSVTDLVAGNRGPIDVAQRAAIVPDICRPVADARLNSRLDNRNAAVLAARGRNGTIVELVTTALRDIDADVLATTERCARTSTTLREGNLRGARIDTEYTRLSGPGDRQDGATVEQSLLTRSEVTTTLPDGGVSKQVSYAGYAILARPAAERVTVQLTAGGEATPAATPPTAPAAPVAPLTDDQFGDLFADALAAAER